MHVSVKLSGKTQLLAFLDGQAKKIEPTLIKSLNATGTRARTNIYVQPLKRSLKAAKVRKSIRIWRANRRRIVTRLVPVSASVPVAHYVTWGYENAGHPTRARIWVQGPDGKKVAAGFVNPLSQHKLALSTRTTRQRRGKIARHDYTTLQPAEGPSVAYWFKGLTTPSMQRWTGVYLRKEFERRMRQELKR